MTISRLTYVTRYYTYAYGTDRVFGLVTVSTHDTNDPRLLTVHGLKRERTFARARHVRRHIISRIMGCSQIYCS